MTERVRQLAEAAGEVAEDPGRPRLDGPDPAAEFGRLYDEYARSLHRYLARRVGEQTAYDLVSETFLTAMRQRRSYDPARAAVRAWLYGIATNLARRHTRQEVRGLLATARAASRPDGSGAGAGLDGAVADRLDAQAQARRLAPRLAELSDADRDVLLLTAWAGLNSVEVADALDIPVGTVRSRLHRVRRALRGGLDADDETTKVDER